MYCCIRLGLPLTQLSILPQASIVGSETQIDSTYDPHSSIHLQGGEDDITVSVNQSLHHMSHALQRTDVAKNKQVM